MVRTFWLMLTFSGVVVYSSPMAVGITEFMDGFDNANRVIIPTVPSTDSAFWYTDTPDSYRVSWMYWTSPYLWNSAGGARYANVWKNLGESINSPVLQASMRHGTGFDTDSTEWSYLWLKDGSGNGYMGRINRPGTMELYRVTGGNLSLIAILNGSQVPDGNMKIMKLSVSAGVVTLSFQYPGNVCLYSVSASDSTYTSFTLMGLGGQYSWGETHGIDDIVLFANPMSGTPINYSQNYNSWANGSYLPTSGSSGLDYWFCDVADNYFASTSWWPDCRLWNSGEDPRARDANCWRSFRAGGQLTTDQVIVYPVLQALMTNGVGSDADPTLWSRAWLTDENGSGYMGRINRVGQMEIYRVDNGSMVQVGASDETQVPNGDTKIVKLSVINGTVTLSFQYPYQTQIYALSVEDNSYAGFTRIGLGGQYGWSESHTVDDVGLTGVIVSNPQETVSVDFSSSIGTATWRASGFLNCFSTTQPQDALLTPLKIKAIRCHPYSWSDPNQLGADGAFDIYNRAVNLGINKIQCVISDNYGYASPWPGDNGDWTAWENTVRAVVQQAVNEGKEFYWDIWNEPNGNGQTIFGKPANVGWPQFLEAWSRAYAIIRSINPTAKIVGPSLAGLAPDYQYIGSFIDYARTNNVLPDILSWHDHYDIMNHVNWVRAAAPGIPISINEYTDSTIYTNAGYLPKILGQLEEAQVESACHAIWADFYDENGWVTNHTLDAILKPGTFEERPAWWIYKEYADITGSLFRISGTPGSYNVPVTYGVAGYDAAANTSRILIGKDEGVDAMGTNVVLTHLNNVPNLSYSGRVRVEGYRIPNTGWEPLSGPVKTIDSIYSIANDQVTVTLKNLRVKDAYTLSVTLSSLAFSDGFETGWPSGWQSSGCSLTSSRSYLGSYSVLLNNTDSLIKSFSTANLKRIQIRYTRYIRSAYFGSAFIAEWSADGGTTWTTLENVTRNGGWTPCVFDLPATAENNPLCEVRFRMTQGTLTTAEGYLDEVKIVGDPVYSQNAALPGDANGDGKVNFSDYLLLSQNFGLNGTPGEMWGQGDFNDDGTINFSDYLILSQNFGAGGAVSAQEVAKFQAASATLDDASQTDAVAQTLPCTPVALALMAVINLALCSLSSLREQE